jgi:hypothetical protein
MECHLGTTTDIVFHLAYVEIVNCGLALPESPITANAGTVSVAGKDRGRSHEIRTDNNITVLRFDLRDFDCDRPVA